MSNDFCNPEQIINKVYNRDDNTINTSASGEFATSGLKTSGIHTKVLVNSTSWTALPSNPLLDRNAIAIQNNDESINVKVNYDNTVSGFEGMTIRKNGGERQYDIKDTIIIYAKAESGSVHLDVEELS